MIDAKGAVGPPPSGVVVELVMRQRRGVDGQVEVLFWPDGWRLPQVGETVQLKEGFGGFVEYVEWDIAQGLARVVLR